MTSQAPKTPESRQEAVRDWERETDEASKRGRQFSGRRLEGAARPEWLTKAVFLLGTAAVVFFVFAHGGKEDRARQKEARAAANVEEPSVRDFRPPVMPVRTANAPPVLMAEPSKSVERPAARGVEDAEAAANRRKAEQLEEARTKSDLLVKGGAASAAATPSGTAAFPALPPMASLAKTDGPIHSNRAFAREMSGQPVVTAYPKALGNLECLALQGKLIDAELETAINTDLPGQIRAILSSPLYAERGREPLVPAGSRLNGLYNSAVRKGQVRVFAIWNRLIRPDGIEITLDSGVTDALGRAGMAGETDNHFGQIFGMSVLLSIVGAGASSAGVSADASYNSADAYRHEIQQSFARTADRVLEPYANIPPTNTVAQGERIKVFLNRDLDFCGLKAAGQERTELVLP
jgi:type IV secretion system protein VirB10